jgi:hypothetical protein
MSDEALKAAALADGILVYIRAYKEDETEHMYWCQGLAGDYSRNGRWVVTSSSDADAAKLFKIKAALS